MKLPNHIKSKMIRVMEMRTKAGDIEQEIMDWFEKKGVDTETDAFIRVVDKLSHSDATPEQIEDILEDIAEGCYR